MRSCRIYYWDNGVGVKVDSLLIKECLDNIFDCDIIDFSIEKIPGEECFDFMSEKKSDIGIFIQNFDINHLEHNKVNIFIVNEEWLTLEESSFLNYFDYVIVKNDQAKNLIKDLHPNVKTLYFWSRDLYNKTYCSSNENILHFAGRSIQKNTESLLNDTNIHIFDSRGRFKDVRNELYYTNYISDSKLSRIFNSSFCHVCPSLYEGHGHYMFEGLLCDKNIIASSIPVWTEQIDPDYVNFVETEKVVMFDKDYEFLEGNSNNSTFFPFRRGYIVNNNDLFEKIKNPTNKPPRKYILDLFIKNKNAFIDFFKNI